MEWVRKYIGLPYKELGRDDTGVDCYGLCCVVYNRELGLDLPDFVGFGFKKCRTEEESAKNKAEVARIIKQESNSDWIEVDKDNVQPFDLVLFRICGYVMHIGIMLNKDTMLHSFNGMDCVQEKLGYKWSARVYKFVRHRSRISNAPSPTDKESL